VVVFVGECLSLRLRRRALNDLAFDGVNEFSKEPAP